MEHTVKIREPEIREAIAFWLRNEKRLIPLEEISLIYRGMSSDDPRETSSISASCEVRDFYKEGESCIS